MGVICSEKISKNSNRKSGDNKFKEKTNSLIENKLEYIPCLFYSPEKKSDLILLYFHSNYEDIGN